MERLTVPDVRVDEHTVRRTIIDTEKVKENAMEFYWRLKEIEDVIADEESEEYDLDRLRELAEAVRSKRCFALPVLPDLRPGITISEVFILLDSGEIMQDNVCSIEIGPNSSGEVDMLFITFDYGDFGYDDVGKRIFWKIEDAQKAADVLKGEQNR